MLTKVVDALFTDLNCIDNNEIEVTTSCWNGDIILIIDCTKVTQATMDTLQAPLTLCIFQFSCDSMPADKLLSGLSHMVDLFRDLSDRLLQDAILLA